MQLEMTKKSLIKMRGLLIGPMIGRVYRPVPQGLTVDFGQTEKAGLNRIRAQKA